MATIIETIDRLCEERGIKGSKLCDDLGISRSTLTELRKGRAKNLSLQKATLIANYFGVTVEYLSGTNPEEVENTSDTKKEKPVENDGLTEKDKIDIAKNLEKLMADLENSGDLMFDGDPASPEAIDSIRNAMAMALEYAKKVNKEKYTPKKYKK